MPPLSGTSNTVDAGVDGQNTATGPGVRGQTTGSVPASGVEGASTDGRGVTGESGSAEGVLGVSRSGQGVFGASTSNNGVMGRSTSGAASGVYGENTASGFGVAGRANSGVGVLAESSGGTALTVNGKVHFSRSGRSTIAKGFSTVNVTGVSLTANSMILATLQTFAVGVFIEGVLSVWFNGFFEIHLNQAAPIDMPVAWLVID